MKNFSDEKFIIQRSPRILPKTPTGEIEIEQPSTISGKPSMNLAGYLLPLIGSITLAIISSVVMKSTTTLIMAVGGALIAFFSTILIFLSNLRKYSGRSKAQQKKYVYYLNSVYRELDQARSIQRETGMQLHPSASECIAIVANSRKQLWEKTIIEPDFLHIRLGSGKQATSLKVVPPKSGKAFEEENPLYLRASQLAQEMEFVDEIPVALQLLDTSTVGIAGNTNAVSEFLSAFLIHLTTHHGYDDVKLVVVLNEALKVQWDWVRWLPHCWDEGKSNRYIAADSYEAARLADELLPKLKSREQSRTGVASKQTRLPHYVFLMLDQQYWAQNEILSYLLANETHFGLTSIFLSDRIDFGLPLNCQTVIEIDGEQGIIRKNMVSNMDEVSYRFRADLFKKEEAEQFARQLAPYRIITRNGAQLPSSISFLETFGVKQIEELCVNERWRVNQANKGLAVPLGIGTNGASLMFDLHEKAHGPHGLVAGTTGAGKSELLLSLLLALAVNYHPHEVSFVIIDYKGGGMANSLHGLPHLLGTLTNLEGNGINRALASFHSEIQRRQLFFAEAGITHIDEYIVHFREGKTSVALPHLIVVVDEFAELKQNQPEFMRQLVSTARVGRSLGVHLILATQKPSGVVDEQIWSNARFKLCLKVQTSSDSNEMIKRPEAAEIREKGRGYFQVGNNEIFSLFQSAWSGAPYHSHVVEEQPQVLFSVALNGLRKTIGAISTERADGKAVTQLEAVVRLISQLARDAAIHPLSPLWLPPLPSRLQLQEIQSGEEGWNGRVWLTSESCMLATLGLVDYPAQQKQFELHIDLGSEGHLLIYGSPGSGKTTLLKTLVTSLSLRYDPSKVNFYILDFGTRTLGVFQDLPHLADVIFPEDEEKLKQLFAQLQHELEQRKKKFAALGISNLQQYRLATNEDVASIVLIMDNYTNFSESYIELTNHLASIVREGGNYGIHFIATANATNSIPYRITQSIKQIFVLQMAEASDYSALAGRTEGLIPQKTPGRGLIKHSPPLEFQAAAPFPGDNEVELSRNIRNLCEEMSSQRKETLVKGLLSGNTPLRPVEFQMILESSDLTCPVIPLGVVADRRSLKTLDLNSHHSCLICTNETEHKSGIEACEVLIQSVHTQNPQAELYLVDSESYWKAWKTALPHVNYMTESTQLLDATRTAIMQLQMRKKELREKVPSGNAREECQYVSLHFPLLIFCISDLWSAVTMMENESRDHLERITRHGAGLGVFVMVIADMKKVAQLQIQDSFTRALIAQHCSVIIGNAIKDYSALVEGQNLPSSVANRSLQNHEAVLLMDEEHLLIQIPVRE